MLKIYGVNLSAPANKVRFVANYIGLEYEYIQVQIGKGEGRREEYLKIHPAGKVPAIDDNGFTLFESDAICRYLAVKHHSDIYPTDIELRAKIDQWSDFSTMHVGQAMSKILFNTVFYKFAKAEKDERSLSDGKKFINRFLPVVDNSLSEASYLASGSLSLADISLLAALDPAEASGVDLSEYKNIVEWRDRLKTEEFYTKCHKSYESVLEAMQE